VSFDFEFAANLARGSYAVEVNMFDAATQRPLSVIRPAVQFTVNESVTYDGIANLFLSGARVPVDQRV
jgi:hypothetical protein